MKDSCPTTTTTTHTHTHTHIYIYIYIYISIQVPKGSEEIYLSFTFPDHLPDDDPDDDPERWNRDRILLIHLVYILIFALPCIEHLLCLLSPLTDFFLLARHYDILWFLQTKRMFLVFFYGIFSQISICVFVYSQVGSFGFFHSARFKVRD